VVVSKGVCRTHGAPKQNRKKCSHDGCTENAQKGGLCWKHGDNTRPLTKRCCHEGCTKLAIRKGGFCGVHFTKVTVEIGVKRPTSGHPLGLIIFRDDIVMKVKSIATKSIFFTTQLTSGMYIDKINGKKYKSYDEGMDMLRGVIGRITIVASYPRHAVASPVVVPHSVPTFQDRIDRLEELRMKSLTAGCLDKAGSIMISLGNVFVKKSALKHYEEMMRVAVETKDKALETQLQTEQDLKIEQMMMALNEADDEAGVVVLKLPPTLPTFLPTAPEKAEPMAKKVPPTKKEPVKKNTYAKKGTKKYDSSDEDENSDDFMGNDGSDSEVDVISAPVPARESSGRVAAKQVTYAMDDSDEDESDEVSD